MTKSILNKYYQFIVGLVTVVAIVLGASTNASAQESTYRYEIGAGLGMSGYLGEANTSSLLKHPGFAGTATFRYLINTRWALRGSLGLTSLSGNSADMTNVYPGGQTYEFKATVYDVSARAEFNFFNYGVGETYRKMKRWSPYLGLGIGFSASSCDGNTSVAATIPMCVGVRYKASKRVNIGLEFTMNKVFGDKLDGKDLTDLYGIKSSFVKNTDWYSTLMFTLGYEFGERCKSCYYVD
ncbi:MAG: porin family protein [Muribaculum sp.]|nr:porin family protein [Muribaculaceae bacterium]MCM1080207.1 porin family protein [Muribaculum sp.]